MMKMRSVIWTLILLVSGGIAVSLFFWQKMPEGVVVSEQDIANTVKKLSGDEMPPQTAVTPLALKRPIRLAIGNLGLTDGEQNSRLNDLLLVKLTGAKGLNLVERQSLETVLHEINMSLSGVVRAKDAVRAGKLVRADWFLLASPTRLNETNFIVARIVDAHTGILHEAAVFESEQSPERLASALADFVRECRQNAAKGIFPVYLSLSGFADVGVNSRQAEFPVRLRSYLTAAYQKSSVTILEREFAETLLNEVWLDLAGLTDESSPGAMQSAYWIVDGTYQSYETTTFEVELVLNIRRMFGKRQQVFLRNKPDEKLFKEVKKAIDTAMQQDRQALKLSRVTEVRALLRKGKDLANLGNVSLVMSAVYQRLDDQAAERQRRNVEKAMRSFRAVLLLSPTNREAKMYLAACLRNPSTRRDSEARDIYHELLDENVQDGWVVQAQRALVDSFRWLTSDAEKAQWFATASQQSSNSPSAEFYRRNAEDAAVDAAIESGEGNRVIELAEKRFLEEVRSHRGSIGYEIYTFRNVFRGDETAAAQSLAKLLPIMRSEFPRLTPNLTAEVLKFQTETNTSLVGEFWKQMERCLEHPDEVSNPRVFWDLARHDVYEWFMSNGFPNEAVRTMENYKKVAGQRDLDAFEDRDQVALAYAYMGAERWKEALEIFESFTNKVVNTFSRRVPWGNSALVLTGKQADFCRIKLGLSPLRDRFEQELEENVVCLHTASDFVTDGNGIWVAIEDKLLFLGFDLKTNLQVTLPKAADVPVTCLALDNNKVWVGTKGAGLMEFDRKTSICRPILEKGLLMNYVSSLYVTEDSLWIGYGSDAGGGLGQLNLLSQKLKSFMSSINPNIDPAAGVDQTSPGGGVVRIIAGTGNSLWMQVDYSIRQFDTLQNSWITVPVELGEIVTCIAANSRWFVEGSRLIMLNLKENKFKGPLAIQSLRDHRWQNLVDPEAIATPPTAMTLNGNDLWVGGEGYVALIDLSECKVRKFWPIQAKGIDRIQIGGGYVWAQYGGHLHRASLAGLTKSITP